jgi:hypothetical protein
MHCGETASRRRLRAGHLLQRRRAHRSGRGQGEGRGRDVEKTLERIQVLEKRRPDKISGRLVPVLYTLLAGPPAVQRAREWVSGPLKARERSSRWRRFLGRVAEMCKAAVHVSFLRGFCVSCVADCGGCRRRGADVAVFSGYLGISASGVEYDLSPRRGPRNFSA